MAGLTSKQAAFAREYLTDSNAAQSAIRAGYSPRGANVMGSTLLSNISIRAEITRLQALAESEAVASHREACEKLTRILRGDDAALAIKACERLAKLLNWDAPTKIAPTTPDGTAPYQPALSPDAAAVFYLEAMQRAVAAQPPK